MEIHLCSLSLGHNSSPGRGGGRRGHNFATCRLTCRCYASRDAVKRLLISDTSPSSRRPGLQRWHCRKGSPQSFQFSRSRCLTEVRTRRSSTETCTLSRCLCNSQTHSSATSQQVWGQKTTELSHSLWENIRQHNGKPNASGAFLWFK